MPGQGVLQSANEKALSVFFKKILPPGWRYSGSEKEIKLERLAAIFVTEIPPLDLRILSNAQLIERARREGKKTQCTLTFRVERHDDTAIVRQKVRLSQEVRDRVRVLKLEPKKEFEATKKILTEKLEAVPFYRIGTLYLYPRQNQCITHALDWYFSNTLVSTTATILPHEAREEIEIIYASLSAIEFWH